MTIAFDGKKAARNRAGLGNYSRFVITALARRFPDVRFDVYVSRKGDNGLLRPLMELPNVNIRYPSHPVLKYFPRLWERYGIVRELRRHGADIYHGLGNELPANIRKAQGTHALVTIHDLIFLRYPEYYTPIDRKIYNFKFRYACHVADRIVAISECTKRDIMHFYHIPEEKIDRMTGGEAWQTIAAGMERARKKETVPGYTALEKEAEEEQAPPRRGMHM